jgi:hypothetical protein
VCGFYPPDIVAALPAVMVIGTRRKLSHGHKALYARLVRRWGQNGPCFPGQVWLAEKLGVSVRTVKMWIEDLEGFGLIKRCRRGRAVGGDGQTNEYTFLWHSIFEVQRQPPTKRVLKCQNDGFEVQESARLKCKNQQRHYKEETCPETRPETERHYSPVVCSSPAENNAASEKPSPKWQSQNPKPASGENRAPAFDTEVAEIREALKARQLLSYTPAFDPVIREMLASGETVEVIKRGILRGCWLKLACRDRGDTSLIFSMRYFLNVIPEVKPMADAGYWRNIEQRLGREEQKRFGQQTSSPGREHAQSPVSAPRPFEDRGAA